MDFTGTIACASDSVLHKTRDSLDVAHIDTYTHFSTLWFPTIFSI